MKDKLINDIREYFGRRTAAGVPDMLEYIMDNDRPDDLETFLSRHSLSVGDFE